MASVTASTRPRLITAPFVVVTLATLSFFVFVGIAVTILPRFIEHELGGDGLAIGVNLAVFSVAAIAVRPLIARIGDRYGRRFLMVGGALMAGVAVAPDRLRPLARSRSSRCGPSPASARPRCSSAPPR